MEKDEWGEEVGWQDIFRKFFTDTEFDADEIITKQKKLAKDTDWSVYHTNIKKDDGFGDEWLRVDGMKITIDERGMFYRNGLWLKSGWEDVIRAKGLKKIQEEAKFRAFSKTPDSIEEYIEIMKGKFLSSIHRNEIKRQEAPEVEYELYQVVVQEFTYKYYGDGNYDDVEATSFNIDKLIFNDEVKMKEYLDGENEYEDFNRELESDNEYLRDQQDKHLESFPADSDDYEMLDADWGNGEVFKTFEEASDFLDKEHIAPYKKKYKIN